MQRLSVAFLAIAVIAAPAFTQCSTLTITGTINPGQTVTVDVTGAPANAMTFLLVGDAGTTTIPAPGGGVTLGVEFPAFIIPLGITDSNGAASQSATVPANIPAGVIQDHTFTAQAVSVGFSGVPPTFSFCVSNTASLVSGNG